MQTIRAAGKRGHDGLPAQDAQPSSFLHSEIMKILFQNP